MVTGLLLVRESVECVRACVRGISFRLAGGDHYFLGGGLVVLRGSVFENDIRAMDPVSGL